MNVPVPRDAAPLGFDVPRIKPPISRTTAPTGTVVAMDAPDAWQDTPCIPDQLQEPELWRSESVKAHVFDLSKTEDLSEYNNLLAELHDPKTNKIQLEQRIEAFKETGSWKVLILVQTVKFRKIITKSEKKTE